MGFVDFAIEPVSADQVLHGLLNVEQHEKVMNMSKLWWSPQGKFTTINL